MTKRHKHSLYEKIRAIFREHYVCAFRNDLNPEYLDCLVDMAEEVEELIEKEVEKRMKADSSPKVREEEPMSDYDKNMAIVELIGDLQMDLIKALKR